MATEKQILLNRFDLGISDQERDLNNGYYSYLENVELKVRSAKQVANNTVQITNKNLRAVLDINGVIYGLGWANPQVTVWADLAGTPYANIPATGYSFNGKTNPFFVTDGTYIYFDNLNHIGRYKLSDNSFSGDWTSISGGLSGGVAWNKYFYGFQGQDVYVVDITGATATKMVSVPTDQTIVQLVPYGQLLAVICTSSTNESYMFLWDGVNVSATPWYDTVKIGFGTVNGAALLDGVITAVISLKNYKGIRIRKYNGNVFTTDLTYYGRKNLAGSKYITGASTVKAYTNYLYFIALGTRPNSANYYEYVVMRYGREDTSKQLNLSVWKTIEIATGNIVPAYTDFAIIEDTDVFANTPLVSVYATIVTDTNVSTSSHNLKSGVFTSQPGVIETGIFTGGDSSIKKGLSEMSIKCDPLTSGQSIKLLYKGDAETTWKELITISTVGTVSYEPLLEADGSSLSTYKEVQLRFELLGEAKLTGFSFKYEEEVGQRA